MKLASFTMFRNEASILGAFLDQLDEFFEHKILVNHESSDNSTEIVRARKSAGTELFHLKSSGYPQSQLATYFAHRVFEHSNADWLFFLDCDEFLPFRSRDELVRAILDKSPGHDLLSLHWRNLLPRRLDGEDIFSSGFLTLPTPSKFEKIILSRRLVERARNLIVQQGYHGADAPGITISRNDLSERGLFHIPVPSKYRFAAKIKASGQKLIGEAALNARGLGYHWVGYHLQLEQQGLTNFDFARAALHYPGTNDPVPDAPVDVDFKFDYVKTPYKENYEDLFTQLYRAETNGKSSACLLYDDAGNLLRTSFDRARPVATPSAPIRQPTGTQPTFQIDRLGVGEFYSDVIEPLFSLPIKMPPTAWKGHIPFLFVLLRLMRPRNFVELGVHYGSSLIAAATAARAYQIPMRLYGVDSWEGDAHAGNYEGNAIYQELASFVDHHFTNVQLIRSMFDEANQLFSSESIDLLHIDGLHTYDAVKHDFLSWLPKMSPSGVVLFHDTTVRERNFGVYRFWAELEKQFTTLQFFHSFGLGVLFLDDQSDALQPLIRIVRNEDFTSFYQSIVSDIGGLIEVRMKYLENQDGGGELQRLWAENQRLEDEIKYIRAEAAAHRAELKSLGVLGVRRMLRLPRKQ